ncbi:3-beta hydroxysteroid dehydrogenase [Bacillus coahuilensis p1.1.43]|uniref:3-beta hydroxysteroid dehydrogenase n=1 Tax=Bacillus coahuilensis p1.1.43 TaxID=1150625 RepID=A0A147KA75_9BACI|nr:SDR family oxidoreductase [Bacillus coahuilensis]KUP07589.1 3-beta hydroxysteroid dehydrogenase [Bacillus coahuilensis p1.1.43]
MSVHFVTGFPGFLSEQLIKQLLLKKPCKIYCLCLHKMKQKAQRVKERLIYETGSDASQITILLGDITKPNLGLSTSLKRKLQEQVRMVWHLAAIYDLATKKEMAYEVNVIGTRNVNEFVLAIKNLDRYMYFSTAYVAGTRAGMIFEEELIQPLSFYNYYEETKYFAECLVQPLKDAIPITIIRPSIVWGHSLTGETTKFDGPYFLLNMFDRLSFLPFYPSIGNPDAVINVVPFDYVIDSSIFLSELNEASGKTYHLVDPNPENVRNFYQLLLHSMLNKETKGSIPSWVLTGVFSLKMARKYFRVEKESIVYFKHTGLFNCDNTLKALSLSGITCASIKDIVPTIVEYYQQNKQNNSYHISYE